MTPRSSSDDDAPPFCGALIGPEGEGCGVPRSACREHQPATPPPADLAEMARAWLRDYDGAESAEHLAFLLTSSERLAADVEERSE